MWCRCRRRRSDKPKRPVVRFGRPSFVSDICMACIAWRELTAACLQAHRGRGSEQVVRACQAHAAVEDHSQCWQSVQAATTGSQCRQSVQSVSVGSQCSQSVSVERLRGGLKGASGRRERLLCTVRSLSQKDTLQRCVCKHLHCYHSDGSGANRQYWRVG
jgi:hypothetical protein